MAWPGSECRERPGRPSSSCRRNPMLRTRRLSEPAHYGPRAPDSDDRTVHQARRRFACLCNRNAESQIHTNRPGRRKTSHVLRQHTAAVYILAILVIGCLFPGVSARSRLDTQDNLEITELRRSSGSTLAGRGDIIVDRSDPPKRPSRMRLRARRDASSTSAHTTITVPVTVTSTSDSEGSPTSTSSLVATASPLSSGSLPKPFDTNLGNNFTSTCLPFFQTMLDSEGFNECEPFSLLLQNSQGFFQAEKSLVSVTQVLDASCDANFDRCSTLMSGFAVQLQEQNNCGTDFQQNNPVVAQAYYGLISYQTMYQAGCLKDSSGSYCFADAVTNSSSISDTYPYYLPLHMELPGGARPTCNTCLQQTMQGFASAATNGSQPVSSTYVNAAQQINIACGPNFVNANVQVTSGASHASLFGSFASLAPLALVLLRLVA